MALLCSKSQALSSSSGRIQARSTPISQATFISRPLCVSAHRSSVSTCSISESQAVRRDILLGAGLLSLQQLVTAGSSQAEGQVEVVADEPGFGQHAVGQGDLVLVHYTGTVDGQVFDSTRGGLKYRDGGLGVFRPVVVRISGSPVPGICLGLQQAIQGMTIGGKRVAKVPASLGFGNQTVLAPYAIVPGGSTVQYDIELLRVSSVGPDLLVKGISRCGAGGAAAAADNCRNIEPAEFF